MSSQKDDCKCKPFGKMNEIHNENKLFPYLQYEYVGKDFISIGFTRLGVTRQEVLLD